MQPRLLLALFAVVIFYGFWVAVAALIASAIWPFGFAVVLSFVGAYIALLYWNGPFLIKFQLGVQDLNEPQGNRLKPMTEDLAAKAGIAAPELAVAQLEELNAFAVGRKGRSAIILTTAVLREMRDAELNGILAHEVGHIRRNDSLWLNFFLAFGSTAAWMARGPDFLLRLIDGFMARSLPRIASSWHRESILGLAVSAAVVLARLMIWISVFSIRIIFFVSDNIAQLAVQAQSREQEFLADRFAAQIGHGIELTQALEKIERLSEPSAEADPLARLLGRMFSSHPPTSERLARLRPMMSAGP